MLLIKKHYIHLTILLIVCSCKNSNINSNTILKFDNLTITYFEYEKELSKIPKDSISLRKSFRQNFIENSYFINDGYEEGFGDSEQLIEKLNSTSDFMMVQKYGYLWQETTSPIIEEYTRITQSKLEKRSRLFYYDYIRCDHIDSLSIILGDERNEITLDQFNTLKREVPRYKFLTNDNTCIQWPFGALFDFKDILYRKDIGLISQPVIVNNVVYYFYLDRIGGCKVSEVDEKALQQELKTFKELEIDKRKTIEMDSLGEVYLFDENINQLAKYLISNKELNQYPENIDLIKYRIDNLEKVINSKEFFRYQRNLPFKTFIKTRQQLVEEIKQYFYDDYLKEDAKKLGLYNSKKFLLERKNYQNKLVLNQYLKSKIEPKIKIDSLEIINYYHSNQTKFMIDTATIVDLYYFKDIPSAEIGIEELSKFDGLNNLSNTSSSINGLIAIEQNVTFNNKYMHLSNEIYQSLKTINCNTIFKQIIPTRDKFVVLLKKDIQLHTVQKLDNNLYQEIYKSLHQKKFEELRTSLLNELTKKYKIKRNKIPDIS